MGARRAPDGAQDDTALRDRRGRDFRWLDDPRARRHLHDRRARV